MAGTDGLDGPGGPGGSGGPGGPGERVGAAGPGEPSGPADHDGPGSHGGVAIPRARRTSELRLPTLVVPVRLTLVGGGPSHAELFVADLPRRGRGQLLDDVAALLGADAPFLPVRWSHRVRLLGKHAIEWIAIPRRDAAELPSTDFSPEPSEELTLYDREHRVEIELAHGTKLIGTLLDSLPADRTRAIDHLNRAGRFLRLWTAGEHFLINTRQVVMVTELAEPR